MIKNKDSENFIRFIQWSIYSFAFFSLIIWIRFTSVKFDLVVLVSFITGITTTISFVHLSEYMKEKEKPNEI